MKVGTKIDPKNVGKKMKENQYAGIYLLYEINNRYENDLPLYNAAFQLT